MRIYGIDLGTTYSCVAYVNENNKAEIVNKADGDMTTPSVVYFESADNIVVGKQAKNSAKLYPDRTVSFIKREMGHQFTFDIDGKAYKPEELSSFILRKLVSDAAAKMGEEITDVVITCPAYFGINEREATKNAGKLAGLNVRHILNEPTAAAICYGFDKEAADQVVLVYDLGGGTFDITMIEIKGGNTQVIYTDGNHTLGGKDWDDRLVDYLAEQFRSQFPDKGDPRDDPESLQAMVNDAEEIKKVLSAKEKWRTTVSHGGSRAWIDVTRAKQEELTADLLDQTIALTRHVLDEGKSRGYPRVAKVLLVGGSSMMPCVARRVKGEFGVEAEMFEPHLAVAKGAALVGAYGDVTSKGFGVVACNGGAGCDEVAYLIHNNSPISVDITETGFGTRILNEEEYRKQVLSPAEEAFRTSGQLPDLFTRYALSPDVTDESDIKAAFQTIESFWTRKKSNPKYNTFLSVLAAPKEVDLAHRMLLDPVARRELRELVDTERKQRLEERFAALDRSLAVVDAKGYITPQEKAHLIARYKTEGLSESEILSRLSAVRIAEEASVNLPKEGLRKDVRSRIKSNLAAIGHRDLYEFVGVTPGSPKTAWSSKHRDLENLWRQKPNDARKTSANELLSIVKTFIIEGDPTAYEEARLWEVLDHLRPEIKLAAAGDGQITNAEFKNLVALALTNGLDETTAKDYIVALGREVGASVEWSSTVDSVGCPNCFAAVSTKLHADTCPVCSHPLWTKCPRCQTRVPLKIGKCGKCDFAIADLPRAMSDVGSPQSLGDAEVDPLSLGDRGAATPVSPSLIADPTESADDPRRQFAELLRAVEESNRISAERERVIDRLYEENQRLRSGELEQALMPVLRDLMRLFDDLQKTVSSYAERTSLDTGEVLREWEYYRDSTLDVLFRQGIEPCVARENSVFDPKEHRACGTISTTDKRQDRTIARVIRVGFRTETRVLRTADVEVFRANTEAETQSKG